MSVLRKVQILAAAVCVTGSAFLNLWAALIMLVLSVFLIRSSSVAERRRDKQLFSLCDEIDRVLRGNEAFQLERCEEGTLGVLTEEISKMTIRLREQNAALREDKQFLKESMEDISHQLRTPLTSSVLVLDMLRKPNLTRGQQMQFLQELYSLTARMQWQIETLLRISRMDAGAVQFRNEEISCRQLLRDAAEPLQIPLELKEITLTEEISGKPVFTGDMQYCTEAVGNILKNCMEHTPRGGSIRMEAEENSIYTAIRITDSGNGIAEKDLPHIFERFYRGSEFSGNGYGIGLAFAKKVVRAMDGTIKISNAEPQGAQFEMRFYKTTV